MKKGKRKLIRLITPKCVECANSIEDGEVFCCFRDKCEFIAFNFDDDLPPFDSNRKPTSRGTLSN